MIGDEERETLARRFERLPDDELICLCLGLGAAAEQEARKADRRTGEVVHLAYQAALGRFVPPEVVARGLELWRARGAAAAAESDSLASPVP